VNIRVYVEYIEESYVNQRIPITISETKGSDVSNIAQSSAIYLPGLDSDTQMVRGEYIEATVTNTVDLTTSITKNIEFDLEDVLEAQSVQMNNGWLEVYIEATVTPVNTIKHDNEKCTIDNHSSIQDQIFGNLDVLKIKPGFSYSSVADTRTFAFNSKSYAYKDSDGEFFHQKDIELIDGQVQDLNIFLGQNFQTASHMIGLIIEAPLEGNTEAFMHGEPKPDCSKNECIYSDKGFNGHMISYVFNANIVSRVRLWFYKIKTLNSDPDCTPYHFTIKSTPNYLETHNKEKVACMDEIFPAKITARRFAHKEISDTYIVEDYFRVDSFTDISFSGEFFCLLLLIIKYSWSYVWNPQIKYDYYKTITC